MIWGQIACGASGISADCVPGVALAPRGSSLSVGCSVSADSLLSMSFIFCFFYLNILGLLVSLDGQDHHPPALITPGPGTRQPGAAPVSQSPLKVFKWINPKPVYPSCCLFLSAEATIKGLCHISPLSLCLLTHPGAILCGPLKGGGFPTLGNCEWKTIFIECCYFLSK